jgi:hypothetical protein
MYLLIFNLVLVLNKINYLHMLYNCLPCVCYYTHCSYVCLITGVWNLSTSTDYICCIVVSLVYVITPIAPMGV